LEEPPSRQHHTSRKSSKRRGHSSLLFNGWTSRGPGNIRLRSAQQAASSKFEILLLLGGDNCRNLDDFLNCLLTMPWSISEIAILQPQFIETQDQEPLQTRYIVKPGVDHAASESTGIGC
jgi:hypothetical protein